MLGLRRRIEDVREKVGEMPTPVSEHATPPHRRLAGCSARSGLLFHILGGIIEQIHDHLFNASRVGIQPNRLRRLRHRSSCRFVDQRSNRLDGTLDNASQIEILLKPDPSGDRCG